MGACGAGTEWVPVGMGVAARQGPMHRNPRYAKVCKKKKKKEMNTRLGMAWSALAGRVGLRRATSALLRCTRAQSKWGEKKKWRADASRRPGAMQLQIPKSTYGRKAVGHGWASHFFCSWFVVYECTGLVDELHVARGEGRRESVGREGGRGEETVPIGISTRAPRGARLCTPLVCVFATCW